MPRVDISVILACYNEGPTFEESVQKILKVLRSLKESWEIIFVEDKSTDETREIIRKLVSEIPNSRVIYHQKNQGRGKTVSDGIRISRGQICGYLDVDLEVSPYYIPLFVNEIENGADMVVGQRFYERDSASLLRFIASKLYSFIVRFFLKLPIADTESGYKFFRKSKIAPILSRVRDKQWFWDTEICADAYWAGLKIQQIPVLFIRRHDKKSTVRLIPDTWDYLVKIIKFRHQVPKKFKPT